MQDLKILGPGEDNLNPQRSIRPLWHLERDEAERVAKVPRYSRQRVVWDLVRAGEWNEHLKQKHPDLREVWEEAERKLYGKTIQIQRRNSPEPGPSSQAFS